MPPISKWAVFLCDIRIFGWIMNNRNEIGEKLQRIRKERGLSQKEVAERINRTQYYVSRCETGDRRIDIIELSEFASVYNVSILIFFEGENNE